MVQKKRVLLVALSIAVLLAAGTPLAAWDECNTYEPSRVHWIQGYGPVCAYTGGGCTECASSSGAFCVAAHPEICEEFDW